ncbi:MerR family transcriptional regulator [Streptomyces globisporus]|uniref:MerR family transcriptional regulator n=1 Tax=Streptomyces globisporus TaxID=1908 RepID=UPI00373AEEFF
MVDGMSDAVHGIPTGAVARRPGVSPTTARSWDPRYGIGPAVRADGRHRRWSPADVVVLKEMCRLTASGAPPAAAVLRSGLAAVALWSRARSTASHALPGTSRPRPSGCGERAPLPSSFWRPRPDARSRVVRPAGRREAIGVVSRLYGEPAGSTEGRPGFLTREEGSSIAPGSRRRRPVYRRSVGPSVRRSVGPSVRRSVGRRGSLFRCRSSESSGRPDGPVSRRPRRARGRGACAGGHAARGS